MKILLIDKVKYFMRFKARRVEEFFPGYGKLYWDQQYETELLLQIRYLKRAWNSIVHDVRKSHKGCSGLPYYTCPFCIDITRSCSRCHYGKFYGMCLYEGSNYRKVVESCRIFGLDTIFPHRWYKRVIELIENGGQL